MNDTDIQNVIYEPENEPLNLAQNTYNKILGQNHSVELLGLYMFYYNTAKWQKNRVPKCTSSFVAKALGWSERKVKLYKKKLVEIGLVENIKRIDKDSKKVSGWYVKVLYIPSLKTTVQKSTKTTVQKSTKTTVQKNHPVENLHINTQENNINTQEDRGKKPPTHFDINFSKENEKKFIDIIRSHEPTFGFNRNAAQVVLDFLSLLEYHVAVAYIEHIAKTSTGYFVDTKQFTEWEYAKFTRAVSENQIETINHAEYAY